MNVDSLELGHVKSHLQKYRTEKKRSKEKEAREGRKAAELKVLVLCQHDCVCMRWALNRSVTPRLLASLPPPLLPALTPKAC